MSREQVSHRRTRIGVGQAFAIIVLLFVTGCTSSNQQAPAPRPPVSKAATSATDMPFERGLDYVQRGKFKNIFVIARQDGAPLQAQDKDYLRKNTHQETNMWVVTNGGRRVVAGTNFVWTPENMDALRERFVVEDYTGK